VFKQGLQSWVGPMAATCGWALLPCRIRLAPSCGEKNDRRDSQIIPNQREWMLAEGGTIHVLKDNDRF
jgi:hypothetical protein